MPDVAPDRGVAQVGRTGGRTGASGDLIDPVTVRFGEALVSLAGTRPELLVVSGTDPGPLAWFGQIWPERLLTVQPGATRLSIAEGIAAGGGTAVVALDDHVSGLGGGLDQPIVLLSTSVDHLALAYRAGITVVQAGWPGDLSAVLDTAIDAPEPVLVVLLPSLAGLVVDQPEAPVEPGNPRIMRRGRAGMVVGAGPTSPAALAIADRLIARGIMVTAVDSNTLPAASGVDPTVLTTHVLVGALDAPRAGALTAVEVRPRDLAATTEEVRRVIRP